MIDEPVRVRMVQHGERGSVATVSINNPMRLNNLGRAQLGALVGEVKKLGDDPLLRAVIVTGEGDRAFIHFAIVHCEL